jgi:hypothetical protein
MATTRKNRSLRIPSLKSAFSGVDKVTKKAQQGVKTGFSSIFGVFKKTLKMNKSHKKRNNKHKSKRRN